MKLTVSAHAIFRYKTRVRDCATKLVVAQIEAAYATGSTTRTLPGGHRFVDAADLRLVVNPENVVMTVYVPGKGHCPGLDAKYGETAR
ncbi:MAG: hypothetical protein F4Y39_21195 [Gemmatimonadetes bacterium]|nr:hypothetical protein [Gemmatimonadota bacterium]MYF75621.1 hypothetical protein [Gemmatimonadota bacterium]